MTTVRDLLAAKGGRVWTCDRSETVMDAVHRMNDHRVGALVVMDGQRIMGIFTERDVLQRVVSQGHAAESMPVMEVTTAPVRCCSPEMNVDEASRLMRDHRIRHLPVCDAAGKLLGIVSIGDVNAYHVRMQQDAIQHLEAYVYHSV